MKTIWKFDITEATAIPAQLTEMPAGARILSVYEQDGLIILCALVDPEAVSEPRDIRIRVAGEQLPDDPGEFIGTVHMSGYKMDFHVFEVTR